jgi:hypothetical protein
MMTQRSAGARPTVIQINLDIVGTQNISNLTILCQVPLLCLKLLFVDLTSSIPLLEDLQG